MKQASWPHPEAAKESFQALKLGWSAAPREDKVPQTISHELGHGHHQDSLWRENRQLRWEVQSWQEEAAARQRENTELRLEVAQLHAELHAERCKNKAFAQTEGQGGATSSSSSFRGVKVSSDWMGAVQLSNTRTGHVQQPGESHSSDLAAMATKHAAEVAALQLRHCTAAQELQSKADELLGRARLAEDKCATLECHQVQLTRVAERFFKVRKASAPFLLWRKAAFLSASARQRSSDVKSATHTALEVQHLRQGNQVLHLAFNMWLAALEAMKSTHFFEAQMRETSAQQTRAESALVQLTSDTSRRRILTACIRAWARLLREQLVEKVLHAGNAQIHAWRREFLEAMFLQKEEDHCEMLLVLCWRAWGGASDLEARQQEAERLKLRLRSVERRLLKSRVVSVGATAQVQLKFLLRVSFVSWWQLRYLENAVSTKEESRHLHISLAQLCYSRDFTVERIAKRAMHSVTSFCLALAWTIWRRCCMEAALIQDCDAVKALLAKLQGEWARQHELQQQEDFADMEAQGRLKQALALSIDELHGAGRSHDRKGVPGEGPSTGSRWARNLRGIMV